MKRKVLIVDDDADVRMIIGTMLKTRGMEVQSCGTASQCLTEMLNFRPDVVILDIDLPDGSGLDILPEIIKIQPGAEVIMNSALGTTENKQRARELGSVVFLTKPLNRNQLLTALEV